MHISGYLKVSKNGGEYSKQGQLKSSLRGARVIGVPKRRGRE